MLPSQLTNAPYQLRVLSVLNFKINVLKMSLGGDTTILYSEVTNFLYSLNPNLFGAL